MEINRNQYLLIGLVVLFLGIQLRMIDSYVLNEPSTQFLAKRLNKPLPVRNNRMPLLATSAPTFKRTITPPQWLGWAMLSVGGVLILHSLAMQRPGGG